MNLKLKNLKLFFVKTLYKIAHTITVKISNNNYISTTKNIKQNIKKITNINLIIRFLVFVAATVNKNMLYGYLNPF